MAHPGKEAMLVKIKAKDNQHLVQDTQGYWAMLSMAGSGWIVRCLGPVQGCERGGWPQVGHMENTVPKQVPLKATQGLPLSLLGSGWMRSVS